MGMYSPDELANLHNEAQEDSMDWDGGSVRTHVRLAGVVAITVGLENRLYGGPEEGGWYYDSWTPLRVIVVPKSRAGALRRRLAAYVAHCNEGEYPPSSTLCSGWTTLRTGYYPDYEPRERPYYE